jgi:hypothetical protein
MAVMDDAAMASVAMDDGGSIAILVLVLLAAIAAVRGSPLMRLPWRAARGAGRSAPDAHERGR